MKNIYKPLLSILSLVLVIALGGQALAVSTVNLGTADGFAVLGGTSVTNVPTSVITGNVGLSPAAGSNYAGLTTSDMTTGSLIYSVDGTGPAGAINNPALLTSAKNDLTAAYLDAAGKTPVTNTFVAGDNQLGGQTLTPGVYAFGHASSANITASSPLTLDAQNDPLAVFVFQASSDLVTASGSTVRLVNGAQACNVFWQVTSSMTLGTGSTFVGNVLALTSITDDGSSTVNGRLLARNADAVLNKTTITKATCTITAESIAAAAALAAKTKLPNTGYAPKAINNSAVIFGSVALSLAGISALIIYTFRKYHSS